MIWRFAPAHPRAMAKSRSAGDLVALAGISAAFEATDDRAELLGGLDAQRGALGGGVSAELFELGAVLGAQLVKFVAQALGGGPVLSGPAFRGRLAGLGTGASFAGLGGLLPSCLDLGAGITTCQLGGGLGGRDPSLCIVAGLGDLSLGLFGSLVHHPLAFGLGGRDSGVGVGPGLGHFLTGLLSAFGHNSVAVGLSRGHRCGGLGAHLLQLDLGGLGIGPGLLGLGDRILGGLVGLGAQSGLLLDPATLLLGGSFGGRLSALRLGDPDPGLAADLFDLEPGGVGVGSCVCDLLRSIQQRRHPCRALLLGLALRGGLLGEAGEQHAQGHPPVGHRSLRQSLFVNVRARIPDSANSLQCAPSRERLHPGVLGQVAVPGWPPNATPSHWTSTYGVRAGGELADVLRGGGIPGSVGISGHELSLFRSADMSRT